jgi:Bacterial Ig-like domain (group 1)/PASTA domain
VSDLVERIGNKIPGQLVRSEDWDMLVEAVDATNTRIDDLVQSSCTVHADPGDDLQQAIAALPETGGELCLSAGVFSLAATVLVKDRRRVVVNGAGPATVLRCPTSETVLAFEACREVEVRNLRIEGGSAGAAQTAEHLNGALTFAASTDIVVSACTLSCPDAARRAQACLLVRGAGGPEPDRVRVERCELEVGAWQTGMLLIDVARAAVVGNSVRLPHAAGPDAVGQGIVVAGSRIGTIQLLDNVVEDAVQGIHVGVARGGSADAVVLDRNIVHAFVPAGYRRDRHAVFVGNATSVQISGTVATLRRTTPAEGELVTPVEAIRIHGAFGPFVVVRDTSARNFSIGVRIVPLLAPSSATWVVADTMAEGAAMGADVPESVEQQRNRPEPPVRRVGPPARIVLTPAVVAGPVGTEQRVTATVRDIAGLTVPAVSVRFAVTGANPTAVATAVDTDENGIASFEFTGTAAGTDTVTAYADTNRNAQQDVGEPFASATRTQIAAQPAAVTFEQASVPATVNTPAKLAAVVRDAAGNPIRSVSVRFSVSGANTVTETAVTTDDDGRAAFSYTGTHVGTDTVTAAVGSGAAQRTGTAIVTYLAPVPARVVVAPAEHFSFRGAQHCVTATVTDPAGTPIAGATIVFAVTGINHGGTTLTTDAQGRAQFCYTGTNAGTDRITAFADVNKNGIQDVGEPFAVASQTYYAPEPTRVIVPTVVGATRTAAVSALTKAGLAVGRVTTLADPRRSSTRGVYTGPFVVDQNPDAGARVVQGSAVNVTLQREFEELGFGKFEVP